MSAQIGRRRVVIKGFRGVGDQGQESTIPGRVLTTWRKMPTASGV